MTSVAHQWNLRPGTTYLNHGSFGPPPRAVREARRVWIDRLDEQPMDFFVRQYEGHFDTAREKLADFVGCQRDDLIFVENATAGMNVVAQSVSLQTGDEVLLTDHEYGAVQRIWERVCTPRNARAVTAPLPERFDSVEQVVDALFAAVTPATRLIVVSQITSPTTIILPVREICEEARRRGVAVCVDGPHALATLPLDLRSLNCDYFTASCHKWLSAAFGSGFLYVHRRRQHEIQTPMLSWGRLLPAVPETWRDEFTWTGTRDPSAYLTIPTAIEFLESFGLEKFRRQTHALASTARRRIISLTGLDSFVVDDDLWQGPMTPLPLPPGDAMTLQQAFWDRFQIEVPIVPWKEGRHIRVSCHLYNTEEHIDRLVTALQTLLGEGL